MHLNTRTSGGETGESRIDYVAASDERGDWVTNEQTRGVSNPSSPIHRKTIQIDIRYDIIRTRTQNIDNKHIGFDIKQLRENAITTQRDPSGGKIQK